MPTVKLTMNLVNFSRSELIDYTTAQLSTFFPDGKSAPIKHTIEQHIDEALSRLMVCVNAVKTWEKNSFNYLHSSQYCTYLYLLANTIWRNTQETDTATKLFLLNKMLNGIDMFYEIKMPDIFFIGHSTGIVLAKADYSNYFVIYQNSTVGKNHGIAPSLGEGVIMYPNSAIIGRSIVGDHSIIAQGVSVTNTNIKGSCMVFSGETPTLSIKPLKRNILEDFFRI
jgi:serine O-acetyltransferase